MLVDLGNANFIMNHKFTEKRQNNCETEEVDDRCAHGVVRGMLWEAVGRTPREEAGSGEHEGREQSWGKAGSPLGFNLPGLGRHKTALDLWEGCYWERCI